VTHVRKEVSSDGSHRHIIGVCTDSGRYYTRREVVDGIETGKEWVTSAGGKTAQIRRISFCPARTCFASPYITTLPDQTGRNDLENLPEC
jgi:hypothetical protein